MTNPIGRTVVAVKYIETNASERPTEALVFNDGSELYALRDAEGNGHGCMVYSLADGKYIDEDEDGENTNTEFYVTAKG